MDAVKIRAALALAVAVAVSLTVVSPAIARPAATNVGISKAAPAFHGHVRSTDIACTQGRRVKLVRVRAGRDKKLGRDRSEDNGRWQIDVSPLRRGTYYARAPRTKLGNVVCAADVSRTVTVN